MNNIIESIENKDYLSLNKLTKDKSDNLNKFYHAYASSKLDNSYDLMSFFKKSKLKNEEANIIYDLLDNDLDNNYSNFLELLEKDYQINKDKPFSDEDVIKISNNIILFDKEIKKDNTKTYVSIAIIILSLIMFIINLAIYWKLDSEVIYFTTILLTVLPSSLLVFGLNMLLFKKKNYLLMAIEAFIIVYLISFLLLNSQFRSDNFLVNVKNHFFEVVKSIYSFFEYHTFKLLEV